MTALEYLESLIAGMKVSSIPIQISELKLLLMMMKAENGTGPQIFLDQNV